MATIKSKQIGPEQYVTMAKVEDYFLSAYSNVPDFVQLIPKDYLVIYAHAGDIHSEKSLIAIVKDMDDADLIYRLTNIYLK